MFHFYNTYENVVKKAILKTYFCFYAYFNVLKERIPVKAPTTMFLRAVFKFRVCL